MNVNQYLDRLNMFTDDEIGDIGASDLLELRLKTFHGFCDVEMTNGGLDPSISVSTPRGQEQVRILFARTMEELMEAFDAIDPIHFQEELIDAVNFGTAMIFLNLNQQSDGVLQSLAAQLDIILMGMAEGHEPVDQYDRYFRHQTYFDIGASFSKMLESLRNRAWQNNSQHQYFQGHKAMVDTIITLWLEVIKYFPSHRDFILMYLAKDQVLQFRLKTKY